MKLQLSLIILLLVQIHINECKLEFVVEIFRHGAREPIFQNYDNLNGTRENGELTGVGQRMHFLLGDTLRKKYIDDMKFLSPSYNATEFHAISTDFNRTIMSAQSQLYGLFPITTGQQLFSAQLQDMSVPPLFNITYPYRRLGLDALPNLFQPIPIHTINSLMLLPDWWTDNQTAIWEQSQRNTSFYKSLLEEFSNTFQTIRQNLDMPVQNMSNLVDIYELMDTIVCDYYMGQDYPSWMTSELTKNMTFIYNFQMFYNYLGTLEMQKYQSTPFNQYLSFLLSDKVQKPNNNLKWQMISAHDTNIGTIAAALNFTSYNCLYETFKTGSSNALNCHYDYPIFASHILFELHQNDTGSNRYMRVFYNGQYMNLCEKNETTCDYQEFYNRIQEYIVVKSESQDFQTIIRQLEEMPVNHQRQSKFVEQQYMINMLFVTVCILVGLLFLLTITILKNSSLNFEFFHNQDEQKLYNVV